jgi:hypothetical protein
MRLLPLVSLVVACAPRPPDAPEELNELVGYMYANTAEDDPAPLEVGSVNLDVWLDERIDETLEGYTVNNLTEEAINALGDGERDLTDLAGAAVGHESPHAIDTLVGTIIGTDPMLMFDSYVAFERTFDGDEECFMAGDCDWLESEVLASFDYVLMQVETHSRVQYRWVDTDLGRVYVERTWLREDAVVTSDLVEVEQQYYLRVIMPADEGAVSLQATWVVARLIGDMPEDAALNLLIDSMETQAGKLDDFITEGG